MSIASAIDNIICILLFSFSGVVQGFKKFQNGFWSISSPSRLMLHIATTNGALALMTEIFLNLQEPTAILKFSMNGFVESIFCIVMANKFIVFTFPAALFSPALLFLVLVLPTWRPFVTCAVFSFNMAIVGELTTGAFALAISGLFVWSLLIVAWIILSIVPYEHIEVLAACAPCNATTALATLPTTTTELAIGWFATWHFLEMAAAALLVIGQGTFVVFLVKKGTTIKEQWDAMTSDCNNEYKAFKKEMKNVRNGVLDMLVTMAKVIVPTTGNPVPAEIDHV